MVRAFQIRGKDRDGMVIERDDFDSACDANEYAERMLRHETPYSLSRAHGNRRQLLGTIVEVEVWATDLLRSLRVVDDELLARAEQVVPAKFRCACGDRWPLDEACKTCCACPDCCRRKGCPDARLAEEVMHPPPLAVPQATEQR